MSTTYELAGGQVLRDKVAVANYNEQTGSLDFLPDMARFRAPVVRWLRSQGKEVAAQPVENPPATPPPAEAPRPANLYHNTPALDPVMGWRRG